MHFCSMGLIKENFSLLHMCTYGFNLGDGLFFFSFPFSRVVFSLRFSFVDLHVNFDSEERCRRQTGRINTVCMMHAYVRTERRLWCT